MKKFDDYRLLILLSAFMLFCACSESPSPEPPAPTPVIIEPSPSEEPVELPPFPVESPVIPDIDWSKDRQNVGSETKKKEFLDGQDTILSYIAELPLTDNEMINSYYKTASEDLLLLSERLSEDAALLNESERLPEPFRLQGSLEVLCNGAGIISIKRTTEIYYGAGLPEKTIQCETFNAETGEFLYLEDFFTVGREIYADRLMYAVLTYLSDNSKGQSLAVLARETLPYDDFCVTDKGLRLFFQENLLTNREDGIIEIDVPWELIGDIWKTPV